jgi:uncharacterized protein YggE
MRCFTFSLLIALLFTLATSAAENAIPRVEVYGTATTEVAPDQMRWYVTVRNKGPKLPAVAEQHSKIVEQVLAVLKQSGIKDAEVQTARMEFGDNWEYKNQSQVWEGYFASTAVLFRTSSLESYKPLWIGLAAIAGVRVDGVYFDHTKRIDFQNETRRSALLAAKAKAVDLAKTLGSVLGEPLLIEEDLSINQPEGSNISNNYRVDEGASAVKEGLAPGKIPIRIRLKVAFRLISHTN